MTLKECAGSIIAIVGVISLAFGAYFYFERRYALAEELEKTKTRLEQKIQQDRGNAVQERLWRIEDRLQDRKPTAIENEEIRSLKKEKEELDKTLKEKK
jgi:hypothetical protein